MTDRPILFSGPLVRAVRADEVPDARLIAAVPDLLATVDHLHATLDAVRDAVERAEAGGWVEVDSGTRRMSRLVRAALEANRG